jgi:hypothetical protein
MKEHLKYILIIVFQISFSQVSLEKADSVLINKWTDSWVNFSSTAEKIDNDTESLWAYSEARNLIKNSKSSKNVLEQIFQLNKAKTLIFYGMSYTKSIVNNDSLNLNRKILQSIYPSDTKFSYKNLIESEFMVNESMTNFYLVSKMSSYKKLNNLCMEDRLDLASVNFDIYFYSALFNARITNFKIFISFISDIFYLKNDNPTNTQIVEHFKDIPKIAEFFDNLNEDTNLENEIKQLIKNDTILIDLLNKSIKEL